MGQTRILVVEDERIVAQDIKHRLEDLGYEVPAVAVRGQEAILKAQQSQPDLVLMDIRLEGETDGIKAAEVIRTRFHIPVLYLTALTDEETLRRAKVTQPFGYIVKPFKNRDLYTAIEVTLHRHQMERELAASEERYRLHFESVSDLIFSLDSELRLLTVSPSIKNVLGYEPEELEGQSFQDLGLLAPESLETAVADARRVLAGGTSSPAVYEFVSKDGNTKLCEVNTDPLIREGNIVAITAVARDVTERQRAEEALARQALELDRSNAFVAALGQVAARLGRTRDPEQILQGLGAELEALGMSCLVGFLDADAQELVVHNVSIQSDALAAAEKLTGFNLQGLRLPNEALPTNLVIEEQQPVFAPGPMEVTASLLPTVPRAVLERATWLVGASADSAVLYLPLVVEEQVIGVMAVWGEDLREADISAFSVFAAQVASTLESARLYNEAQQRAQELDALNRAGQTIASSLDLDRVLTLITDEVRALLNAEASSVLLYDPASDELIFTAASTPALEALLGVRMPADAGIAGWVFREAKPALIDNPRKDPRFYELIDTLTGMTTKSLLAVPLMHGEKVVGVLEAINRAGEAFEERDLYLLSALASPAAIAIENARLFEVERDQRQMVEQSQAQLVQSEKMSALGRLVASLAHEINNPLQALRSGFSLLLSDQESQDKHQRYLEVANREVERLIAIVERVLGVVRPSGEHLTSCDVNGLLDETLLLLGKRLEDGKVVVQRHSEPDLPPIEARAGELNQVFINLILNALHAMPESGTLTVETRWEGADQVRITFSDTGLGIPEEDLPHMFEPFFTTRADGSGLGLATSYSIVERYGGRIEVESVEGAGSTFSVVLPVTGGTPDVNGSDDARARS